MKVSIEELRNAFTEWDRRYRVNPEVFLSEAENLLRGTPETYGEAATPYFVKIIEDMRKAK